MRLVQATIFTAVAVLLSLAATVMAAEEEAPMESAPAQPYADVPSFPYSPWTAARFGWWGLHTSGSKSGVGEWQGLDSSSPFFDIDNLSSDGNRTLDFFATGVENQTSQAGLDFYHGPGLSLDLDYNRFIHRLGHEPMGGPALADGFPPQGGFYDPPLPNGDPGYVNYGNDLNAGQDYAIRVQTLEANFKGRLTDNVKWRLNFWGMKKEGERQANSQQHCFAAPAPGGRTCHVLSQGQRIDWLTMEIEPVIEANFGWLTVEYSHTLRSFQQNDEMVFNDFNAAVASYGFRAEGAYAQVPENVTDIDRVKLHGQLAPNTEMYVLGHVGNTHNKFRESDRKFYGVDVRLMNTSFDGLSLTAYGKTFTQNNSPDTMALNDRYPAQAGDWLESEPPQDLYWGNNSEPWYLSLVDREFTKLGVKGRWLPFRGRGGWSSRSAITGGYEYGNIQRQQVTYDLENLTPPVLFTQPSTVSNTFFVGLQQDWSWDFRSYLRYRFIQNSWPLVGITQREQLSVDAATNSNRPEHVDRIEIGGNWNVTDNLLVNASVWIENSYNHSEFVNFEEDSYPIVLSAWYAPDQQWSYSAGFATFSNWIDQDITLGRENGIGSNGLPDPTELVAFTAPWRYTGRANVLNLGVNYAASSRLALLGGVEFVRSWNYFQDPPSPATANPDYSDLPGYSEVRVNTYRLTAGVNYELSDYINSYFRYNYYDYDDRAMSYNAGQAHMFLGGLSAVF